MKPGGVKTGLNRLKRSGSIRKRFKPTGKCSRARMAQTKKNRLCCHKRSKSREETPKEGIGGNIIAAPQ